MEGPSQKIFKNGGWLCLTDAKRYYTTLQFWQVTGTADGVYPGYLARFSPYLVSYAGCGRDARVPRGDSPNMDRTPRDPRGYAIISDASERIGAIQKREVRVKAPLIEKGDISKQGYSLGWRGERAGVAAERISRVTASYAQGQASGCKRADEVANFYQILL